MGTWIGSPGQATYYGGGMVPQQHPKSVGMKQFIIQCKLQTHVEVNDSLRTYFAIKDWYYLTGDNLWNSYRDTVRYYYEE
jgi:hypothetical protein